MFGSAPRNIREVVERLAIESADLSRALNKQELVFKDFTLNYHDPDIKESLYEQIEQTLSSLPAETGDRLQHIQTVEAAALKETETLKREVGIACFVIVTACVKCDLICTTLNQFPKDRKLRSQVNISVMQVAVALSMIFDDSYLDTWALAVSPINTGKYGPIQAPTKSAQKLLEKLPSIKSYFERLLFGA